MYFPPLSDETVKKYQKHRKAQKKIHSALLDLEHKELLKESLKELRISMKGDIVYLEDPSEEDMPLDFMFYNLPCQKDGKTAIEVFSEKPGLSAMERRILKAMQCNFLSLFRVEQIFPESCCVLLKDLLSNDDDEEKYYELIDIGFSQTATKGCLLATRLLCFDDFCMTSGVSWGFNAKREKYLLRQLSKRLKKVPDEEKNKEKFKIFFELNRKLGNEVIMLSL